MSCRLSSFLLMFFLPYHFLPPVLPEHCRRTIPYVPQCVLGKEVSLSQLQMLQLCPSSSEINDLDPCKETAPGVGTIDLRNLSAKLLAAKQFLGEKIYFAEFMKLYIFIILHSLWLDPEPYNQAGAAKKLYICLSPDCMQGHACLTSYVGSSSLHIFECSP